MNRNPSPATRFQKGNPGGPGAPRGKRLSTALRELADEPGRVEEVAKLIWDKAAEGDIAFVRLLLERLEGPPALMPEADGAGDDYVIDLSADPDG